MRRLGFIVFGVAVILSIPLIALADNFSNIMFLHHSTGSGLIYGGSVRSLIDSYNTQHGTNLEFWDHGYNAGGVHDQDENYYENYDIPYDNTDPDGFYALFNLPIHDPPDNAFSKFMLPHQMGSRTITHEVFIFKSCFPASNISSEAMLNQYKTWYLAIRDVMDAHPEKIFIPLSPPPLVRSATTPENAARARRFAYWLASSEYLSGHPNVFVYNFWGDLAEHDSTSIYFNCLKAAFGGDGGDSHPNDLGNQTCGPLFVACITNAIETYGGSNPNQPPVVSLHSPNGGEIWQAGLNYSIAWADSDDQAVAAYKLEYSTDAGLSWLPIQDWTNGDPQAFNWNVPAPSTEQARIRISCRDSIGGIGFDISDSNFTIADSAPTAALLAPNGGEGLNRGDSYEIRWTDHDNIGITSFKLDCSTDGGANWITIQPWTDSDPHSFTWVVLAPPTDEAYIRIICRDLSGNTGHDMSDSGFAIYNSPTSCSYTQGDLNGDSQRIASDVTYGVRYFKGIGSQPSDSCYMDSTMTWLYVGGDVNGNCEFRGSDITRLVAFFKGSAPMEFCHFFPPPPLKTRD
jgi:hypothetical protein